MTTLTRSKKERSERIKFVILVVAFVTLSIYTQKSNSAEQGPVGADKVGSVAGATSTADARSIANSNVTTPKRVRTITMQSPEGSFERFSSENQDLEKITVKDMKDLGIGLNPQEWLCRKAKSTPWRQVRQVELELELSYIISVLMDMEPPRRLPEEQQKSLAKVPFCQPYLPDLKVIANLMKGYKLIKVAAQE